MSKIDSTRLSQVLAALAKPKERVASSSTSGAPGVNVKNDTKGLDTLRARLKSRLRNLKQNAADFHEAAPVVTVQEILCWEFGESILEHSEFATVSRKVAETMLESPQLEKTIYNIVESMVLVRD